MRDFVERIFAGAFVILRKTFVTTVLTMLASNLVLGLLIVLGGVVSSQSPDGNLPAALDWACLAVVLVALAGQMSGLTEIALLRARNRRVVWSRVVLHSTVNAVPVALIWVLFLLGLLAGLMVMVLPAILFGAIFCLASPLSLIHI